MKKVAINGFGRIGRNIVRAWLERRQSLDFEIVAINDLGKSDINAHLLKYDSVHGTLNDTVRADGQSMFINDIKIQVYNQRDPKNLPWAELGIDLVMECTGFFTHADKARAHIDAGAKKVIMSAPSKDDTPMFVMGVNQDAYTSDMVFVSNAS